MKKIILIGSMVIFGLMSVFNAQAQRKKIGMKKARAIAARQATGKIVSGELEKEKGRWIYSFDIRNRRGTITEVNIDAYTGALVNLEKENKKAEAVEKRREKKKN